ncbi:MAG: hypothetical protein EOP06_11825 [Proteobacteria bacterium]|nr:MAG: hypothetical protein EOP06_11825 [Pseudomonadota bacterium]
MKLSLIKYHQLRGAEKFHRIELVAKKGLPAPAVQPLGTVKLAKCALLLNLSDKELAIEHRASLADWTNRHISGGFAMSTSAKFSPLHFAIKKKLHRCLGRSKKLHYPSACSNGNNDHQNIEWSIPISTRSDSDYGNNVSNNSFFILPEKWRRRVADFRKKQRFAPEQGDLVERLNIENRQFYPKVIQSLSTGLGQSSIHITEYYVAMSEHQGYLIEMIPSAAIEDDDV